MLNPFFTRPAVLRPCIFVLTWLALAAPCFALEYQDNKALADQLKKLERGHKKFLRVESAAKTPGKNEVWRVELGVGADQERSRRPAMLVVAGLEGNDLAGTASVVAWMESLAAGYETNDAIRKLLDSTTVHVWPRLNPDAARHFFAKPRIETSTNGRPTDDDHDGLVDEDGPDDLNGDGLITWMRVEDPEGEFIPDPAEPRLLLKADRLKGERGAWRYLSEGRDNDGDKAWNEDALGGVNFNRNFPYNYRFFSTGAGEHQVSEAETRALADFVIANPNIAITFAFGASDNLVQTPKAEAPKRPPVALHEEDAAWYKEMGKSWREAMGLKKEMTGASEPGTFADWTYFHRGRLALAARAWSPALQVELAKVKSKDETAKTNEVKSADGTTKSESPAKTDKPAEKSTDKAAEKGGDSDTRNEDERAFLKWIDANAKESFVPWKAFEHPDFPGKKVEVGGYAPFAKTNPPEKLLADLAARHGKFLTALAGRMPRIGIRRSEAKHLGESVYEVTVHVENTGYLPTALAQGGVSREVHPTRVALKTEDKSVLSGSRVTTLNAIQSGEAKEVRWVVRAKGAKTLEVEVISMLGGRAQAVIELKEGTK